MGTPFFILSQPRSRITTPKTAVRTPSRRPSPALFTYPNFRYVSGVQKGNRINVIPSSAIDVYKRQAYNYSLGGSIVDPRIKLLQVTPIAPMNTTAYRSFTSSILLPSELSLGVVPEIDPGKSDRIFLLNDGIEHAYSDVKEIKIEFSETVINLLRFETYDFWDKVKTKFL